MALKVAWFLGLEDSRGLSLHFRFCMDTDSGDLDLDVSPMEYMFRVSKGLAGRG